MKKWILPAIAAVVVAGAAAWFLVLAPPSKSETAAKVAAACRPLERAEEGVYAAFEAYDIDQQDEIAAAVAAQAETIRTVSGELGEISESTKGDDRHQAFVAQMQLDKIAHALGAGMFGVSAETGDEFAAGVYEYFGVRCADVGSNERGL